MSESPLFRSIKPIETRFKTDAEIVLFPGDANEFLTQVPDNSVALVVTSPPYNLG
ncbi:MAG: site-specific DNA-methyltransferase, partial [Acidobacteria bacterium]